MVGLYREPIEEAAPSVYLGGGKAATEALEIFQVQGYAGTRNKLGGNVSRLSFYIRHGVLGIREVAENVRDRFGKSYDTIKFWQELGWRQFWQVLYRRWGMGFIKIEKPPKYRWGTPRKWSCPRK